MPISIFGTIAKEGNLNLGSIDNLYILLIRLKNQLIYISAGTPLFFIHLLSFAGWWMNGFEIPNN
jgi:hypothetical protein